ncbi:hypothetical protein T440DRAFT_490712 [Plenodomus tracheiphilus IPT5]|uniref:Uncharacterized protein n=1 Tax=Plenodomus tracheiphilus IPT5 TaxID=1408161 RepID=A0A6A7B4A0_9PLEO|nr:hypothetical protein T440DRAFT_490712 [Plenodomus tracheiphilus IPT5]
MDTKHEHGSSSLAEDPFSTGLRSLTNSTGVFTTNPHIHSEQNNPAITTQEWLLTNGVVRPIYHNVVQPQPSNAEHTSQALGMVSRPDQNTFRSQLLVSPQKQDALPGLGQTGAMAQYYPSPRTASGQDATTSCQDIFGAADKVRQVDHRDYTQLPEEFRNRDSKIVERPSIAKQQLQPQRDIMEDLKRLLKREIDATSKKYAPTGAAFSPPHLEQRTRASLYEPAAVIPLPSDHISPTKFIQASPYSHVDVLPISPKPVSPTKFTSPTHTLNKRNATVKTPTRFNGQTRTPTKLNGQLNTPKSIQTTPTSRQSTGKSKGRHHRTATPEQRTIREMMGGKPVFTMGMKEQDDRCLFFDFFEQIKQWAATYTVHLRSLNAEQIHGLATHPAIAGPLGEPSKLTMLVTEKDMITAMVASIICRHVVTHALDEHSLRASGHPQADTYEALLYRWTLLPSNDDHAKHTFLLSQQQIYTAIKDAPNHRDWRAATASHLAFTALSSLSGLLATNLAPTALTERNHTLTELYVKGYRIGFRLRMSASWWSFQWPLSGVEFEPAAMVNENRLLYGDVLRTMTAVMQEPGAHEVRFAVSPTVARSVFGDGGEERVVAHHAMVHITRRGCV